jgi:hypothetical protein
MAAINFPSSPTQGQSHTENGQTWYYDGVKWVSGGTFGQSALTPMYQQGLWTPTVSSGTITTAQGHWTRIGNRITVDFSIKGFSDTTSSNIISVNGVPYGREASVAAVGSLRVKWINVQTLPITLTAIINNASSLFFYGSVDAGDLEAITHTRIVSTESAQINGSLSYLTDDTTWTPINGATVS